MKAARFKLPIDATLYLIGGKWKCTILCCLIDQAQRTGELRRLLSGISQKVLTEQLRELENDGLIARIDYQEIPLRVEYRLTEFGWSLEPIISAMCNWGSANLSAVENALKQRE